MIKHIWTVLCRRSVIDKESNNISLFDIFERLDVRLKPDTKRQAILPVPIKFEVISLWERPDGDKEEIGDMKVELYDPQEKKLNEFSFKVSMPSHLKRMRSRVRTEGLKLTMPGRYIFGIKFRQRNEKKYKTVARIPLEVHIKEKRLRDRKRVIH